MKKIILMILLLLFLVTTTIYAQSNVINQRRMSVNTMDNEAYMEAKVFETGKKINFEVKTDKYGVGSDTVKYLISEIIPGEFDFNFKYKEYKKQEENLDEIMIDERSFVFSEIINEPGIYAVDIYLDLDQYASLIIKVVNDKNNYNEEEFIKESYIRGW